jgi:methylated-DNA-[protein]-cysteine S-methyltransferase
MEEAAYTLFETPIGPCALAWRAAGIVAVQLPEGSAVATAARLRRRFRGARPQSPPRFVQQAVGAIRRLLQGKADALSDIRLDLTQVTPFCRRIYAAARAIPAGATLTYGELAARAGKPGAARAVGQAMARNPFPLIVPCHRVMAAGGKAGGFSAHGGVGTKFRLLRIEGAQLPRS